MTNRQKLADAICKRLSQYGYKYLGFDIWSPNLHNAYKSVLWTIRTTTGIKAEKGKSDYSEASMEIMLKELDRVFPERSKNA